MLLIDQGEKKLIKRDLLDENGDPIPFNAIVELTFDLVANNRTRYSYSLSNGDIAEGDSGVKIEFNETVTAGWVSGVYDLRSALTISDERFDGNVTDIQTQQNWANVLTPGEDATGDTSSIETGTIAFKVIPDGVSVAPSVAPTQAPFIESHSTATTTQIFWSSVDGATRYEYEIESNPGVYVNAGSSTQDTITALTGNTTDRWRVRGVNNVGEGPFSSYQSFTTNPATTPSVSASVVRDVVTFTIQNPDGLDVEINNGSWVNEGNVTEIVVSGLAEGESLSSDFRFRNAGGSGPTTTVTYQTTQRPQSAPTITATDPNPGFNTVNINLIQDIDSVEYRLDAGTPVDVGLTSQFNVTASEGTYNLEVRYTNEWGGGEWSAVEVIEILENIAPTVSNPSLTTSSTSSSYTVNFTKATDNSDDTTLQYFLVETSVFEEIDLTDKDIVTGLTPIASGTDISQFVVERPQGFEADVNVYVKDQAGNVSLYTPKSVRVLEPEVVSILTQITRLSDSASVLTINGNAYDEYEISWQVSVADSNNEDVVINSSDSSVVVLSEIDYVSRTAKATLQAVEDGNTNTATISIVADLDGFTETINAEVSTLVDVANSTSTPLTFDVV